MEFKTRILSKKFLPISFYLVACTGSIQAKEPFHYGIGICEYAYSERTGSIVYGVKRYASMPEEVYEQQVKYCSSKENLSKAESQLTKWKNSSEAEFSVKQPQSTSSYNRAVDMVSACVSGSQADVSEFQNILKKYIGQKDGIRSVELIRRSYEYGRTVARNDSDCTAYAMGR